MMPNEEALDNLLVRQKDLIIHLLNNEKFVEAETCLQLVTELWSACNYDYKLRELRVRMQIAEYKD